METQLSGVAQIQHLQEGWVEAGVALYFPRLQISLVLMVRQIPVVAREVVGLAMAVLLLLAQQVGLG